MESSHHVPYIVRNFSVYARHIGRHHTRVVSETSFEAAAIAYVEGDPHDLGDQNDVHIIVCDLETGQEHSFHIHLDGGITFASLS